jgi:hypothetical protein
MTCIRLHRDGFIANEGDKSDYYYHLHGMVLFCDPEEPPARVRRRMSAEQALMAIASFIFFGVIVFTFIRMMMLIYRVSELISK